MRIDMSGAEIADLRARLEASDDAEATGDNEYVADCYDADNPLSVELAFEEGGIEVLACEELAYDEAMDGWYLSGPVTDASVIRAALLAL